jgi:hypothetical protein
MTPDYLLSTEISIFAIFLDSVTFLECSAGLVSALEFNDLCTLLMYLPNYLSHHRKSHSSDF